MTPHFRRVLLSGAAITLIASSAHGATSFTAYGTDAIYGAGLTGNGVSTVPSSFLLTVGIGRVLTFSSVTGATNCCSSPTPTSGPDGSSSSTDVTGLNGISGISASTQMFLAGVFIDSGNPPTSGSGPTGYDYGTSGNPSTGDSSFASIGLNRAFFIGDGLTGTGTGTQQQFHVPDSADTLLLGFVDSFSFHGPPSYYGDNTGSLSGTFTVKPASTVPLPTGLPLIASGLGLLALLRRRKPQRT